MRARSYSSAKIFFAILSGMLEKYRIIYSQNRKFTRNDRESQAFSEHRLPKYLPEPFNSFWERQILGDEFHRFRRQPGLSSLGAPN